MQRTMHQQRGFTLTEMAIVVVLGGILLAAGLMAGRGQISRAQAQDVIQIASDLQTASASFKQRYGYLPGDWKFAANTFPVALVPAGGTGGTLGDGLITGTLNAGTGIAAAGSEIAEAPTQLYAAGLIGKLGTNPAQRIQSQFGPVQIASATAARTSAGYIAANASVKNVIIFYNLPCEVVLDVDRALDDGIDSSGKAQTNVPCTAGGTALRFIVPL